MPHQSLTEINNWFNEPAAGSDRSKLLSKLALLELCGWVEGELDRIIEAAQNTCLLDMEWTQKNVLDKTFGFSYIDHVRPMICRLYGEASARKIEARMQNDYPGQLEQLKSELGSLWKEKCRAAHADLSANKIQQLTFQAPSWAINRHRIIEKILSNLKTVVCEAGSLI